MELISNLFQFAVTLLGFCMSGIRYLKGRKQTYFLLTCFYGCFALGSLYWTLYLLLFSETLRFCRISRPEAMTVIGSFRAPTCTPASLADRKSVV